MPVAASRLSFCLRRPAGRRNGGEVHFLHNVQSMSGMHVFCPQLRLDMI